MNSSILEMPYYYCCWSKVRFGLFPHLQRAIMYYHSKKTVVDGYEFDSILESEYYLRLRLLKAAGEIKDFKLQPTFLLQPKFKDDLGTCREISYTPDFQVYHNDDSIEIVEVKGYETPEFKIRFKLFRYLMKDVGYKITIVYDGDF